MVEAGDEAPDLQTVIDRIAAGEPVDIFAGAGNLVSEKFHPYLSHDLLALDAASSRLAPNLLSDLASKLFQ